MKGIFTVDSKFSQMMIKVSKLVVLNILWIFTCVPVVTAGSGTTSLYYCLMKFIQKKDVDPVRDYFRAFKANFRQSISVWIVILLMGGLLAVNGKILWSSQIPSKWVFYGVGGLTGVIVLTVGIYYFPLLAKFENTTSALLKTSLLLGIRHLLSTAGLMGILFLSLLLCTGISGLIPFWAFIGFAFVGLINTKLLLKIFRLYGDTAGEEQPEKMTEK